MAEEFEIVEYLGADGNQTKFPTIALRGTVVFPKISVNIEVGRIRSMKTLNYAMSKNLPIFMVAQKNNAIEEPSKNDLCEIGTLVKVVNIQGGFGENVTVTVEGIQRARLIKFSRTIPCLISEIELIDKNEIEEMPEISDVLMRMLVRACEEFFALTNPRIFESLLPLLDTRDISMIADAVAAKLDIESEAKQKILETLPISERVTAVIALLRSEASMAELEQKLNDKVERQIQKNQKEYYLREQIKVFNDELESLCGEGEEIGKLKKDILKLKLKKVYEDQLLKEVGRLKKMPQNTADYAVSKNYLDYVLSLPWHKVTKENYDIKRAKEILDRDHYGLDDVKNAILEYLSAKKLANDQNAPILCLVGPPGVGKTSVVKSVAEALGKKYERICLGGIKDESDIRGHRKTYIGAMPGRIINAIKLADSKNPLILLDEIDKMGKSYNGDPSSALLEVLDSAQNVAFRDHYIELPFDLSGVLFVATANSLDTIPAPLLDRVEIIELGSYTSEEKQHIAIEHLVTKNTGKYKKNNLEITFTDGAISDIILYYTREAGVRELERCIAKISRKIAKKTLEEQNNAQMISVCAKDLVKYLGAKKYTYTPANEKDEIGIARGLAWTSVGGDTLSVEVNTMPGSGKVEITGKIGEVMKESSMAAMSYIRSNSDAFGIEKDFYKRLDIHCHIPEGAVPKDGPSAGITMATAMISALTGRAVKASVAMTGEITLRGRVLPIGGLKEKSIAAYRAGIKTVLYPTENTKDLEKIPDTVKQNVKFIPVTNMDEVLSYALNKKTVKNFSLNMSEIKDVHTASSGLC